MLVQLTTNLLLLFNEAQNVMIYNLYSLTLSSLGCLSLCNASYMTLQKQDFVFTNGSKEVSDQ